MCLGDAEADAPGSLSTGAREGAAVIAIQTAGDQIGWHPHLHALVSNAVWTRDGRRLPISYLDPDAMTRIFQAKVLGCWSTRAA